LKIYVFLWAIPNCRGQLFDILTLNCSFVARLRVTGLKSR
jgi:hypothetical protein